MGKAEKFQDKARQAAERAKAQASKGRGQSPDDLDPSRRGQDAQERAEREMREAGASDI
ncbi:hypothetical protein ACFYZ9_09580 [Streptomyces sp. NPDC001691]|uniref:hypothetical protein n=1 Tax=unclassified Streptomyces TaxID=2593676 RepID=UPI00167913B3|nr:hypothetical protein [Streptomyces sp. SDr-06]